MAVITVRVLTGRYHNVIERGTITTSGAADANFPTSRLSDGCPDLDFRFAAAGADDTITVDLDYLLNLGAFEGSDAAEPAGWIDADTGTGVSELDTAQKNSGASSLLMMAGNATAQRYRDVQARAGEKMLVVWALRGDGTGIARLRIKDQLTGKYLTSAGAWQTAATDVATQTAASWATGSLTFTVESWATHLYRDPILRVAVMNLAGGSSSAWADDIQLVPYVDHFSIHGHNIDPSITVEWHSSTDNFGANDVTEATLTKAPGKFYTQITSTLKRFQRIKFVGTNGSPILIGEWVLGQALSLQQPYEYGAVFGRLWDRVATETEMGHRARYARAQNSRETLGLKWHYDTEAKLVEVQDEVYERSQGDVHPLVIVPDITKARVIHGRIDRSFKVTATLSEFFTENDLTMAESPFPIATP